MIERLEDLGSRIRLPNGWKLRFSSDILTSRGESRFEKRWVMQIVSDQAICNVTGKVLDNGWTSRKWFLSSYMTDGEIVQTALKACLTCAEHEIREQFTYRGQAIFDPHYDIEKLVELRASADAIKERDP